MNEVSEAFKTAHAKSDVDITDKSLHHTIGKGTFQAARGKDLADLITSLNINGEWSALDLEGAWVNYNPATAAAKVTKRGDRIQLQGLIASGTGLVAYLPDGFKPAGLCIFSCLSHGGANYGHSRVDIDDDGSITVVAHIGPGGNTFLSLDEVSFLTSQGATS